jgi:hypothetical protein
VRLLASKPGGTTIEGVDFILLATMLAYTTRRKVAPNYLDFKDAVAAAFTAGLESKMPFVDAPVAASSSESLAKGTTTAGSAVKKLFSPARQIGTKLALWQSSNHSLYF